MSVSNELPPGESRPWSDYDVSAEPKQPDRMSVSSELAELVIAALENYQGEHVSLACRDCAEGAWETVLEALTGAGYEIVKAPTEVVQWPDHPLYVCGHQHASRDEAVQCPVYKEWRGSH